MLGNIDIPTPPPGSRVINPVFVPLSAYTPRRAGGRRSIVAVNGVFLIACIAAPIVAAWALRAIG